MTTITRRRRPAPTRTQWWLNDPPDDGAPVVVCLPYAGCGASLFRAWPRRLGTAHVRALQLPGRESRIRDPFASSVPEAAESAAEFLAPHAHRGVVAFGHCSGGTYALELARSLRERVPSAPVEVVVSAWGPPHRARYGWMNFVDLATFDAVGAVRDMLAASGAGVPDEMVEMMAGVLAHDLAVQRPYLWPADRPLPAPTTLASWADDEMVPAAGVHDGWDELGAVAHVPDLPGTHWDFVSCPQPLGDVVRSAAERVALG